MRAHFLVTQTNEQTHVRVFASRADQQGALARAIITLDPFHHHTALGRYWPPSLVQAAIGAVYVRAA